LGSLRRRHSDPSRLGIERVAEDGVVLVHIHWCAGDLFKLLSATDVIDMGVGDNDHGHTEAMAGEDEQDLIDFVAGVDDDRLTRGPGCRTLEVWDPATRSSVKQPPTSITPGGGKSTRLAKIAFGCCTR